MSITCNIEFDNNPSCTFYGGQILSAKITLNLNETKEVKGVAFKIHGYAQMRWSDDQDSYSGTEDYINIKTFLLGTPESKPLMLQAGDHEFSFNYQLPFACPSSIESRYGQIRYKVKVILIRPWKFDKGFTKGFTVIKLVDLNQQLMITTPMEMVKNYGSSPNKTSPLVMSVSLPQNGYVPGQKIPVNVSISNESGKLIKVLKISLVMITTCYSKIPSRKVFDSVTKISKLKNESIEDQNKHFAMYELLVPPTPPSDNQFSELVHVSYQVEVEAVMPRLQPDHAILVPVIIGNVPLDSLPKNEPSGIALVNNHKEAEAISGFPVFESTQTPLIPPWEMEASNIPPPTYEEAVYMVPTNLTENEEHDYGESNFVPRYPVFNTSNNFS